MKRVSAVITDLDNTLFDWVAIWHEPFKAMFTQLAASSGVPEDTLFNEAKEVFTRHGTTEYAFVTQELPSLVAKHLDGKLHELYSDAIDAYRAARREVLRLYPDVEETLQTLKDRGCLIVGYTESQAFYTNYRMRKLGLDRVLDYLYSPPDHPMPEGVTPEDMRYYSADHYELRRTIHRFTPKGEPKPSPTILRQIIEEVKAIPDEVIYVGDNLRKDVVMAQKASVTDVWAKYGYAMERPEYEMLRRVTHWSAEDVEKEKMHTPEKVEASHELTESFGELLEMFDFEPHVPPSPERLDNVVLPISPVMKQVRRSQKLYRTFDNQDVESTIPKQ